MGYGYYVGLQYLTEKAVDKDIEIRSRDTQTKFFEMIDREDAFLIVTLKGHLFVEELMKKILSRVLKTDNFINSLRFSDKLKLLWELGLIDKGTYSSINKFNSLRNGYSHDKDHAITKKDFDDLLSTFDKEQKQNFIELESDVSPEQIDLLKRYKLLVSEILSNISRCDFMFFFTHKEVSERIERESLYEFYDLVKGDQDIKDYFDKWLEIHYPK